MSSLEGYGYFYFMGFCVHKVIMAVFIVKKALIIFCLLFLSNLLFAKPMQDFYDVKIISVYDGDTFTVSLPCPYPIFCEKISVRVKNIDTPELKTKNKCEKAAAKRARTITENFLKNGKIILKNCERDKYFRLLCEVKNISNKTETDLSYLLFKNNLAYSYLGGAKQKISWCTHISASNTFV